MVIVECRAALILGHFDGLGKFDNGRQFLQYPRWYLCKIQLSWQVALFLSCMMCCNCRISCFWLDGIIIHIHLSMRLSSTDSWSQVLQYCLRSGVIPDGLFGLPLMMYSFRALRTRLFRVSSFMRVFQFSRLKITPCQLLNLGWYHSHWILWVVSFGHGSVSWFSNPGLYFR